MDSISLSATNAAGGTRVIGVGCRYYTTLRRGVFILQLSPRSGLNGRTCAIYTIFAIVAYCAVHADRCTVLLCIKVLLYIRGGYTIFANKCLVM